MANSYCSLQEIPIISHLSDSYKVKSGPGVSVIENFKTDWVPAPFGLDILAINNLPRHANA